MLILALDTSGPEAGVALMRDGALIYEATAVNKLTHSVNLMPMVEEALLRAGQSVGDVSLLAAVVGPGSFTGVRIGVSAVKAMAFARQRPVIGVNALEALAHGLVGEDRLICPIRDARAGQVYGAAFFRGERLMADAALKLPDYLRAIAPLGDKAVFVETAQPHAGEHRGDPGGQGLLRACAPEPAEAGQRRAPCLAQKGRSLRSRQSQPLLPAPAPGGAGEDGPRWLSPACAGRSPATLTASNTSSR